MIKSKQFALLTAIMVAILLTIGNWVTPARATGAKIINGTPIPTTTPSKDPYTQGDLPSPEEQAELKSVIQAYFDIRYRALSVSQSDDFKQNGFGSLVAETPKVSLFPTSTNL